MKKNRGVSIVLFAFLIVFPAFSIQTEEKYISTEGRQIAANFHSSDKSFISGILQTEYLEISKLIASDPDDNDNYGISLAASETTIVIGAYAEDGSSSSALWDSGAVYVYERDFGGPGNWGEAAKLIASDAQTKDYFGTSVAISNDTIVVGAGQWHNLSAIGAVYVFERDLGGPGNWGEAARLNASDAEPGDTFGISVAVDMDTLVVGAYREDGGPGNPTQDSGAVYIFERNLGGPNNWGEAAKLTASDAQSLDEFGTSVSISGGTIVAGAPWEDGGPGGPVQNGGSAYVFERDLGGPNNWGEAAKLTASDAQDFDLFGISVSISGDTLVVGAYDDGGPGNPLPNAGTAYIFERNLGGANIWGEGAKLQASDAQSDDYFGGSVSINGDIIVIGAFEDGGPGDPLPDAGAAYVFERDLGGPSDWKEAAILTASDAEGWDGFSKVANSGTLIVVGAPWEDGDPAAPLSDPGAAYLFRRIEFTETVFLPITTRQ